MAATTRREFLERTLAAAELRTRRGTPSRRATPAAGNQWEMIFDRALARGLSARYYASDLPFSAVWGARGATWTNPITRYYADCTAGTLPDGHESILKLISYRFGLGDLTLRQSAAHNSGLSFDWDHADFDPPALPDPPEVATAPCALGGGDVLDSQAAHASDLAALEQLAERYGVPSYDGKLGDIFTMQRAVLSRQ
jgi:hypothetical protein